MEAVLIDAVRTPLGRRGGNLAGVHPTDLSAVVLNAVLDRNGVAASDIDDVIWGCVSQTGEQALNVGRNALLAAGWPFEVPATTVDRQCGSSQQAIHFAAAGVAAGHYDLVVAGGVESMSRVPMFSTIDQGPGNPFSDSIAQRLGSGVPSQGLSAELIAAKWGVTREEADELSLRSHQRASAAAGRGAFQAETVPVQVGTALIGDDEGIRHDASKEGLARLRPAFKDDGVVTAGGSSQISDGAAAVLIASERRAAELGIQPLARFRSFALAGVDPIEMLTGPIPATAKALQRAGLTIDDIDTFEVNEAFAPVVAAWLTATGADEERMNPNGGAIALGHPLGASGARLMATMVHHLRASGGRFGLQTMCEGGGMANATIIELMDAAPR